MCLRLLVPMLLGLGLNCAATSGPALARDLVDLAGRNVSVPETVDRFIISEGGYAILLALLQPADPLDGLVGMMNPVGERDPGVERQLRILDPRLDEVPVFGVRSGETVSAEAIVQLAPQVAIFGLQDHGPGADQAELIAQLESVGVAVVFIDFRIDPANNTAPSIALVGEVLGAGDRADAFLAFYRERRAAIADKLRKATSAPRVFFQAHVGRFPCCVGFADGMLGPFVGLAGGENIADAVAPGPVGRHTEEFLLVENPDVWIGSASGSAADLAAGAGYLALGAGVGAAEAQAGLSAAYRTGPLATLDAVASGRTHAVWHGFYNSPLNIVALEAMAKWIHPELFAETDPQKTLAEIYSGFLPFELDGRYFASIGASSGE